MKQFLCVFSFVFPLFATAHAQQLPNRNVHDDVGFIWNPAEAGRWDFWEVSAIYAQDWTYFEGAPTVANVAFQMPIYGRRYSRSSIGLFVQHDRIGPLSNSHLLASYSYKFRPNLYGHDDRLSIGIQVGVMQYRFNNKNLISFQSVDQDKRLANIRQLGILPSLGLGVYYRNVPEYDQEENHFFVGLATNQLIPYDRLLANNAGIAPSLHSNLNIGIRRQLDDVNGYIEPQLQLISYTQQIKIFHARASLKFEQYDRFWLNAMLGSIFEFSVGGGIIFDSKGYLSKILNGGALRIGGVFNSYATTFSQQTYPGFEFYIGYKYSNF